MKHKKFDNLGVKYDKVKEDKYEQDAKQAELQKIEEARKLKKSSIIFSIYISI